MAKGIGLIGNFKGKVGNMVGYKLSDSNTGNTQGIRVYQPIVRNPKTSAQAEQRAKLAPINATYRALKMIIDRGNEGLPYGNKSRLAWLKTAFKAEQMPWYVKGAQVKCVVPTQLTKGSLPSLNYDNTTGILNINVEGVSGEASAATIGGVSAILLAAYSTLKAGDQVTIVIAKANNSGLDCSAHSFVIKTEDATPQDLLSLEGETLQIDNDGDKVFYSVIISREGANGEHLRSTEFLKGYAGIYTSAPFDATSKAAAIESYQSATSANADWAEESIQ